MDMRGLILHCLYAAIPCLVVRTAPIDVLTMLQVIKSSPREHMQVSCNASLRPPPTFMLTLTLLLMR